MGGTEILPVKLRSPTYTGAIGDQDSLVLLAQNPDWDMFGQLPIVFVRKNSDSPSMSNWILGVITMSFWENHIDFKHVWIQYTSKYCSCTLPVALPDLGHEPRPRAPFLKIWARMSGPAEPKRPMWLPDEIEHKITLDDSLNATMEGIHQSNGDASSLLQFRCSQVWRSLKMLFKSAAWHLLSYSKTKNNRNSLLTTLMPKPIFSQARRR